MTVASAKLVPNFEPEAVCACNNSCFSTWHCEIAKHDDFSRRHTDIMIIAVNKWPTYYDWPFLVHIKEKKQKVIWLRRRGITSILGRGVSMRCVFMLCRTECFIHTLSSTSLTLYMPCRGCKIVVFFFSFLLFDPSDPVRQHVLVACDQLR